MSASREKKTRQDLSGSGWNDPKTAREAKQRQKEHSTNLLYGTIGVVFLVIAIAAVIWKSNIIPKTATAATVNGEKYTAAEVNFYFENYYQNFVNGNYSILSMIGLDTGTSLKDQTISSSAVMFVTDATEALGACGFGPFEGNVVKAVVVSDFHETRKFIDKTLADVEVVSGGKPYWFRLDENGEIVGGIAKFVQPVKDAVVAALGLEKGCFVGLTAGKLLAAQKAAGVLRSKLGAFCPNHMDKERYEFCWIVDFPMYEIGEESGLLEFCHNPFSMPNGGLEILKKAADGEVDPLSITAFQYDLVCNGVELSSGAVRNHDPEIMIEAFQLVRLGEDDVKAKFPAMYNAFTYGAPPHAGIAPGVDRMVMLLAGEDSIREIIPFPMNKNAQDLMMGAPSFVTLIAPLDRAQPSPVSIRYWIFSLSASTDASGSVLSSSTTPSIRACCFFTTSIFSYSDSGI